MDHPERHWIEGLQQGDSRAFDELYQFYKVPAMKFCISILKDEFEAENIIHEVFIKIWSRHHTINPDRNFSSYLFTSLKNQIFDYLKELKKNEKLKEKFWEKIVEVQEVDVEEKEMQYTRLQSAIEALSPKRKKIIQLNMEEGKSYYEIAEQLNISKNTVKNQLVKAKQMLRKQMDIASLLLVFFFFV